jgi:malonyl-CoA O-methyltransferase
MADKLDMIRLQPTRWVDWGAFLGGAAPEVARRYPRAQREVVEPTADLLQRSRAAAQRPGWRRWWPGAGAPGVHARLSDDSPTAPAADLLWANMVLHGVDDKSALLGRWRQVLAPGGMLMFSCLGPDTLRELRELYLEAGWGPAAPDLWDMHDVGDALVHAGFSDPVMDMEHLRLSWPSAAALLEELRALGGNGAPGRFPGCRTPRWRGRLQTLIEARLGDDQGRPALTFEIIYGHALAPTTGSSTQGVTHISEQSLRETLRARRSSASRDREGGPE